MYRGLRNLHKSQDRTPSARRELLIFVVEDEPGILELVSVHLRKSGFKVEGFPNSDSFQKAINTQSPDLIILDLMLPDADGFDICKYLKNSDEFSHIPIIILTARGEETDRVLGLELGADDYVTKPFSLRELVARVKAVLRRKERKEETKKIEIGGILTIDLQKYEVTMGSKKIELTPTEFRILKILSERKGWVYTRNQILENLWGRDKDVFDRTIDVHIKNLRKKLGPAGKFIKNVRGIGYKLEA
ncbi:MAG TPA: response regulator transcription factor [candidate division WOR-3 bacterium]|uniref:Response regulator transcription factor n=1 Tax=candidate division WOR-3 bacterium TaxID=2052148 RepID=A0A9C9EL53_UNCW3|nr:response regulator transcription factor [candidate division WOR-3 bacterium]